MTILRQDSSDRLLGSVRCQNDRSLQVVANQHRLIRHQFEKMSESVLMVRGPIEWHVLFPQLMERLHNQSEIWYHAAKEVDQFPERLQLALALGAFEGKSLWNFRIRLNSVSRHQMPEKLHLGCVENSFRPVYRHVLLFLMD